MKKLSALRLGLQGKMLGAFAISAGATLVVALIGFVSIRSLVVTLEEIGHRRMIASREMLIADARIGDLEGLLRDALSYTTTAAERAHFDEMVLAARKEYRTAADRATPLLDSDERAKLDAFTVAAKEWAATNDQIRAVLNEMTERKVDAPLTIHDSLQGFMADHLQLLADAEKHLRSRTAYSGGVDSTACRFGKWLATYRTDNAVLLRAMAESREPHQQLHAAIKLLQEHLAAGRQEEAQGVFQSRITPPAEVTIESLKALAKDAGAAVSVLDRLHGQILEQSVQQSKKLRTSLDEIVRELVSEADAAVA